MNERRHGRERRSYEPQGDRQARRNRRHRPDRRLNNIEVEWIPIKHVNIHPATRLVFSRDHQD